MANTLLLAIIAAEGLYLCFHKWAYSGSVVPGPVYWWRGHVYSRHAGWQIGRRK